MLEVPAIVVLVVGILASGHLPVPARAPHPSAAGRCTSHREWQPSHGDAVDCYPYRCAARGCLHACRTADDCTYNADRNSGGWPLACHAHECVPFMRDHDGNPME